MQLKIAVTATLFCSACGIVPQSRDETGRCDQLRARLAHDAAGAAELAVSNGNRRFLAVEGITVTIPGIQNDALIRRSGFIVLEGTTDAPEDSSCEAYQDEATAYAERYNRRVLQLVGGN